MAIHICRRAYWWCYTFTNRWSVIASRLPGRTDNDVKNYWNTKLKKRLLAAAKREGTPPPPPLPPPPFVAAAAESQPQDDRPLPPPPLTPSANLDTSIADTSTRRGSFTASGTSPAVSSSSSWCNGWPPPMDVQDTALLSESISRRWRVRCDWSDVVDRRFCHGEPASSCCTTK
jgi:hypothetical protein